MSSFGNFSTELKQYFIITGNYWSFTLTDGALRMLIVLYFHQLGYSPLNIAFLFLFYEFFGVVTNLVGGWLGARVGLNRIMNTGLALQIIALALLLVPTSWLSVAYVMFAQALSGVAKDLNKMSAKSAIKVLVPENAQSTLYKWVAVLTGSKNTLKGVGFFLGGLLLTLFGFQGAILCMLLLLIFVWLFSLSQLKSSLGKSQSKPKFTEIFSKSQPINLLSGARLFLFGARDVWFVIALPVYLATKMGWSHTWVGAFMASWVIGYGAIQSLSPIITGRKKGRVPQRNEAVMWVALLAIVPSIIALLLMLNVFPQWSLLIGLVFFGAIFAINSAIHSYLIVRYADTDGVSLDVGFYYMANALGRLIGTILSGWLFQQHGLIFCLLVSSAFLVCALMLTLPLPKKHEVIKLS